MCVGKVKIVTRHIEQTIHVYLPDREGVPHWSFPIQSSTDLDEIFTDPINWRSDEDMTFEFCGEITAEQ